MIKGVQQWVAHWHFEILQKYRELKIPKHFSKGVQF